MDSALSGQYGDDYGGTMVNGFSPGSIMVAFTTTFTGLPFDNVTEDSDISALTQSSLSGALESAANMSEGGLGLPLIPGSAEVKQGERVHALDKFCDNVRFKNLTFYMFESHFLQL